MQTINFMLWVTNPVLPTSVSKRLQEFLGLFGAFFHLSLEFFIIPITIWANKIKTLMYHCVVQLILQGLDWLSGHGV